MPVTADGVLVPWSTAAVLGSGRLRRLVEDDARRQGYRVPEDVWVVLADLEAARRALEATHRNDGCGTAVERLRPVESVSVAEAARRLGCSAQNIRKRLARGTLEGWHDGRRWHVEMT